jgi:hypothetical protein
MEKGIDLILPVLMPDKDAKYVMIVENVTYVLIQVKNYKYPISDGVNLQIARKMEMITLELQETQHAYLTINMKLGEEQLYCKLIDTNPSKQKAIILGGIGNTLFPFLNKYGNRNELLNVFDPSEEDIEDVSGSETNRWSIKKTFKYPKGRETAIVLTLRSLLGRSNDLAAMFPKDSAEYNNARSMCLPYYLDQLKPLIEEQS